MRLLLPILLIVPLLAQEKPAAAPAKPEPAKAEAAKPADAKAEPAAESPSPVVEKALSGYIEVGYRWISGVGGDFNTYRSIVNLGEGVRLTGMDVNYVSDKSKVADEFHLQGYNWGGDPYNSARLDVGKRGVYRYLGTYSNIAYFNYLPSFANPTASQGVYLNQRAYDTSIRNFDNLIELFPGKRFIPYFGYSRNSNYGSGITTLVASQNEYPLRNLVDWKQDLIRGGVRIEFTKMHATLEGGKTSFSDNQSVTSTERLKGNRTTPYLGQNLFLTQGQQVYDVQGEGPFVKGLFTATPASWMDFYGQFMFTQPETKVNFNQTQTGNFVDQAANLIFYTQGRDVAYGDAKMPHSSGLVGTEVRPVSRLRVRYTFDTDQFHSAAGSVLTANLVNPGTVPPININRSSSYYDQLAVNNYRNQVEGFFDFGSHVMIRGGFRRETGDAKVRTGSLNPNAPLESGTLERNVGLAGIQARVLNGLTLNVDYEKSDGKSTYFRTGLMSYYKFRTQVRYQIRPDIHINALYAQFRNNNPSPGSGYKFESGQASLSLQWLPTKLKGVTLLADYTRSTIYSDINYFVPTYGSPERSLYRDNAHTGTFLGEWSRKLFKLSGGGAFVRTAGSRPTQYYQPLGRIMVPVHSRIQLYSEWRWYGLAQPFYLYEGFRNHQILTGLRFLL